MKMVKLRYFMKTESFSLMILSWLVFRLWPISRKTKFWVGNCQNTILYVLYCIDATDTKLSQLIWPAVKVRRNDEMIRLGVLHIPYSFRDVQSLSLASEENTEYKAPSSFMSHAIDRLLSLCWWKTTLKIFGLPIVGLKPQLQHSRMAFCHQTTQLLVKREIENNSCTRKARG